jgi:hypothetical protein
LLGHHGEALIRGGSRRMGAPLNQLILSPPFNYCLALIARKKLIAGAALVNFVFKVVQN